MTMQPLILPSNQPPDRFYRGGAAIKEFRRGSAATGDFVPEDWVASTTTLFGEERLGLTTLPNGTLLRDAIANEPVRWLGRDHLDQFGADPKLLVKLLDAGERLPVHAHPSGAFAQAHLGLAHGKAEAWFALAAGIVHVGLKRSITRQDLLSLILEQQADELLGLLHQVSLEPGDTVFVPPGTLHAIGQGNFVVEVQEPEDMSILAEWETFAIDGRIDGHLGLGFGLAVEAIDRRGLVDFDIEALLTRQATGQSVLAGTADEYFRLANLGVGVERVELPATFGVLVVIEGQVDLVTSHSRTVVRAGDTVLVAHGCGDIEISGAGRIIAILPPVQGRVLGS